jgi:hypothetical protein
MEQKQMHKSIKKTIQRGVLPEFENTFNYFFEGSKVRFF